MKIGPKTLKNAKQKHVLGLFRKLENLENLSNIRSEMLTINPKRRGDPRRVGPRGATPSAIDVKNPKESENRAQNPRTCLNIF